MAFQSCGISHKVKLSAAGCHHSRTSKVIQQVKKKLQLVVHVDFIFNMLYASTREAGVGSVPLRPFDPLAIPGSIGSVGYTYGPKPHVTPSPFRSMVGLRDLIKTRTVCAQIAIESVFVTVGVCAQVAWTPTIFPELLHPKLAWTSSASCETSVAPCWWCCKCCCCHGAAAKKLVIRTSSLEGL